MTTTNLYIGPTAVYRRFMAGLNVTYQNVTDDESLWMVERAQRYQLGRMATMLEATKRNWLEKK